MRKLIFRLILVAIAFTSTRAIAQMPPQPDMTIDRSTRMQVIDRVLRSLNEKYIFPDVAAAMDRAIRARVTSGEYERITSAIEFAATLTTHLREVSHDGHLNILYSFRPIPPPSPGGPPEPTPEELEIDRRFNSTFNFGFGAAARLDGNVGYLKIEGFQPPGYVQDTLAAAMNFVANTNALVIDVRENGGGLPETVALIASYRFRPEPVHLNDVYYRYLDLTKRYYTSIELPGKRYLDKPVFVLTSHKTFSAGEELPYDLQAQERATIVGERTGGGAHPVSQEYITEHFGLALPVGRAINPITGGNWEGVGVIPDVQICAALALETAQLAAIRLQLSKTPSVLMPGEREVLEAAFERVSQDLRRSKHRKACKGDKAVDHVAIESTTCAREDGCQEKTARDDAREYERRHEEVLSGYERRDHE